MVNTKKSFFAWWIFIVACLISLIGFGLVVNTIGLFYEPIGVEFHVGRANVALMSTFANVASAITLLFAGKIMSKLNLRWLLTGCFVIIGLCLASLSLAKSMTLFYVVWVIIGIAQPFALSLPVPVLLGNWFKKNLGTVMGIALGISAFGGTIFNPIIGAVITAVGWRMGFVVEGLLVLIILAPACFFIRGVPDKKHAAYGEASADINEAKNQEEIGLTLGQALKTPMFYMIAFSMIGLQFVAGFVQHISAHVVNVGLPLTTGAAVVSGVMLGAAVGKISIGYFLDKFNNSLVIGVYTLFGVVGWGGLLLMKVATLLVASGFILGLGQGFLLVALPYFIRMEFGQKDYSNILSVVSMMGAVSSAVAVSLDGLFYDMANSYSIPLSINVVLYVLAGVATITSISLSKKTIASFGEMGGNN